MDYSDALRTLVGLTGKDVWVAINDTDSDALIASFGGRLGVPEEVCPPGEEEGDADEIYDFPVGPHATLRLDRPGFGGAYGDCRSLGLAIGGAAIAIDVMPSGARAPGNALDT